MTEDQRGGVQARVPAPRKAIDVSFDDRSDEWWEAVALAGLRLHRALDEVLAKEKSDTGGSKRAASPT